ncbi:MAG: hypothetical protein F9K13_09455 [Candidatus Methylomirabilis oxygeniifera]|uniref:Uncharacterized protein n=1 Tax=Methylomirabilis oxygeniifera TaxID=671143 RepID=D5MIU1_METO1|nr:MAG: hypothetical protein F9K13_09455 [Candidatus Methylomirabilis oxyfera]CBE69448.1 exported protein of unknown function [Candidatus Methylomirabilis oxyfera]
MQALYRNLLVTTLCVAVSVLMFDGVSHANGGHSVSKVKVKVRAELEPFDTSPEPDAEGQARHHKEIRKGVIKKDEFKGMVTIPVPSPDLGITRDNAKNADVRLILSHDTIDYAECLLKFGGFEDEDDDSDDDDEAAQAHFRVHVRTKHGAAVAKKGTCDINLTTVAVDLGVPDVQDGDLATITLVTDSNNRGTDIDFLEGTFE